NGLPGEPCSSLDPTPKRFVLQGKTLLLSSKPRAGETFAARRFIRAAGAVLSGVGVAKMASKRGRVSRARKAASREQEVSRLNLGTAGHGSRKIHGQRVSRPAIVRNEKGAWKRASIRAASALMALAVIGSAAVDAT